MNKLAKSFVVLAMAVGVGVAVYAPFSSADKKPSLQEAVANGTAHIRYHKPHMESTSPEVARFLNDSWSKGQEVVLGDLRKREKAAPAAGVAWKRISAVDIDIEFTNQMSFEEAMSFYEAYEQRREALRIGDVIPGVLLHPDGHRVIVYWERQNGNIVYFDLRSNEDGQWAVEAGPVEIAP